MRSIVSSPFTAIQFRIHPGSIKESISKVIKIAVSTAQTFQILRFSVHGFYGTIGQSGDDGMIVFVKSLN